MGSSFFFELPIYVNKASLKGATYQLPGSSDVVQASNHMRNHGPQYLESGSISESSELNRQTSTSTSNQSQMNLQRQLYDSESSQLDASNSKSSLNG